MTIRLLSASRPASKIALMASIVMATIGIFLVAWGIYLGLVASTSFVYPIIILALLSAGISIIVAIGYWLNNTKMPYLHFVSIIHLMLMLILSSNDTEYWYYLVILVASFVQLVAMTITLRSNKLFLASILALVLASASFYYQRVGPSQGIYGTECKDQPQGYCYGLLLGAGYPFQYVLDSPGVSVVGALGYEDNVIPLMFLADILIYGGIIYTGMVLGRLVKKEFTAAHDQTESLSKQLYALRNSLKKRG